MKNKVNIVAPSHREEGAFIRYLTRGIFFIVLSLALAIPSFSQNLPPVAQIKIEGNNHIKEETIKEAILTDPGDVPSEERVREDMEAIYEMGYFATVKVLKEETEDGIVLIYQVKENPLVTNIKFVGIPQSQTKKLKEKVSLETGKPWNFKKAQESRDKILEYFQKKGYTRAKVDFSSTPSDEDRCVAVFNVERGKRARVMEVEVKGNDFFSDPKIRSFMRTRFKRYFDPEILKKDMEKIVNKYKEEGFYFAQFKGSPNLKFFQKHRVRWVRISLLIEEGERFTVGEIRIEGNRIFSDSEIKEQFRPRPGEVFNLTRFQKSISRIQDMYGREGYLFANINNKLDFSRERKLVDVNITIRENDKIKLGKIKVEGNQNTKWRVFKHTITLEPGEVFNTAELRESWRKLYNLGFFKEVKMEPLYTSESSVLDLLVRVKERERMGKLMLGASYNSNAGVEGFIQLSKDNLWGQGKMVGVDWEFGAKRNDYQIQYVDRWWRDTPTRLELNVYDKTSRFYNQKEGYIKERSGVELSLGRPWFSNFNLSVSLKTERTEVSAFEDRPLPSGLEEGEKRYQTLGPSLVWDSRVRDEAFNTYEGLYGMVSVHKSGGFLGGDVNFMKYSTEIRSYFRQGNFWRLPILALRARYRWGDNLPVDEQFYIGGQNTLRGYEQNEFTGSRALLGTLEFRVPVSANSLAYLFSDVGKVWGSSSTEEYKVGYGFGLKLDLPIGVVRIDYGIGEEGSPQIYFGMGDLF